MMTDGKAIYEYCVVRYVADIEREEFINVGLMMMSKRYRWMRCALHIDERRITGFYRKTNIERLRTQLSVFTREDVPFRDTAVEERYRWLAAVKSAMIQISPSHPGILAIPPEACRQEVYRILEEKFEELFRRMVL